MLINRDEAIAAILAAGYEGSQGEAIVGIGDAVAALRALLSDGWEDIATIKAENEKLLSEINGYKDAIAQAEGIIAELRADNHSPRTRWG